MDQFARPLRPAPPAASQPLSRFAEGGPAVYRRHLVLPRLLPLAPDDIAGPEPALGRRICTMLQRALRAERNRGRAGHGSYSLNRHIDLMHALKAERAALAGDWSGNPASGASGALARVAAKPTPVRRGPVAERRTHEGRRPGGRRP